MMKLLSHPFSPYGRKVKMTLAMKGLKDKVEVVTVDTNIPANPEITVANPLAKIPALVLESGECIYDSAVICEYLDSLTPSPRAVPQVRPRALEDADAGARSPTAFSMPRCCWCTRSASGPRRSGTSPGRTASAPRSIARWISSSRTRRPGGQARTTAHLTLAAALGYLDFRHEGKWRAGHPNLVAWLDRFAKAVPSFDETRPKP